nr:transposon Ty3-I Gag-Pol polyprotein [Tanacetum cinerariifolium]
MIIPHECTLVFGSEAQNSNVVQATKERIRVAIHLEYPYHTIVIGSTLTEEGQKALCDLLRRNIDIFAWKPADITGVPRHIAEHRLNMRKGCLPVRKKKRSHAPERNKAIQEDVEKLVDADIMKEVNYHSWLSNQVMVKKHDDSWRMCVDFKDLNKACSKDGYPLSKLDWKKAGATDQRLVDKAFQKQIGRNLEVYVDDLVNKIRTIHEIIRDIEETFKTLREINMKLNPRKCTFGIEEGIFLGYKVNTKGIKVCPDKVEAVLSLPSPKCLKDVQKLNGKLASLNRFLSKSAEKSLQFFKTLKKMHKEKAANTNRTNRERRADCVPYRCVRNHGSEAGLILTNMEGAEFTYALRFRFDATNNEAKYEALIVGLRITEQIDVKNLQTNVDSHLVAQVNESYIAKEPVRIQYLEKVKTLSNSFKKFSIKQFLVEELNEKSINEVEVLAVVKEEGETWMTSIYNYLTKETLLAEKEKARAIRHNMHARTRFVVAKAIHTKYYLPTMDEDARKLIRECQDCQGIDIGGPFPEGPGKVKFLIMVMDYFRKWIKAKHVATIMGNQVKKFVWDNIVCRFGLPGEIISDNGKRFRDNPFKDWYEKLCIRQCFASVKHPQANVLVERANYSLGEWIKKQGLD